MHSGGGRSTGGIPEGSRRGAREGVWGDELESLRDAKPGDILQFEDVVFVGRRRQDEGSHSHTNAQVAAPYGYHRSSAEAGDEADTGHPATASLGVTKERCLQSTLRRRRPEITQVHFGARSFRPLKQAVRGGAPGKALEITGWSAVTGAVTADRSAD